MSFEVNHELRHLPVSSLIHKPNPEKRRCSTTNQQLAIARQREATIVIANYLECILIRIIERFVLVDVVHGDESL